MGLAVQPMIRSAHSAVTNCGCMRRIVPMVWLVAAGLLATSCSGPTDNAAEPEVAAQRPFSSVTTLVPPTPTDPPEIVQPALGELAASCGEIAVPTPSTATGVSNDTIEIASGNDRGGLYTSGSGRGMPEAVVAMADLCNSRGGLAGRTVVVVDGDAAVVEIEQRTAEQCASSLAVVGYGYLREIFAQLARDECGLASFPGWPSWLLASDPPPLAAHEFAVTVDPASIDIAIVGPDTLLGESDRQRIADAIDNYVGLVPFAVTDIESYAVAAEPDWNGIVSRLDRSGAGLVHLWGACQSALVPFLDAAQQRRYEPTVVVGPSAYDSECVTDAELFGVSFDKVLVELPFLPIEDAVAAPFTTEFAAILDEAGAPVTGDALLATASFWHFVDASTNCGVDLSQACLRAESSREWTAGGLLPSDPTCRVVMAIRPAGFVRVSPQSVGEYACAQRRTS